MKYFYAYAIVDATRYLGVFAAKNEEEARALAEDSPKYSDPCLCYSCAEEMDVGSVNEIIVREIDKEEYDQRKSTEEEG